MDSFQDGTINSFEKVNLELNDGDADNLDNKSAKDNGNASERSRPTNFHPPSIPYMHIDIHSFFSDRNDVVERALEDCKRDLLNSREEDNLIGCWLLTEISLWDAEKERIILLTKDSLFSVKYDLICMKIVEYTRVTLNDVDTFVAGELIYPSTSLLPSRNTFGIRIMWNRGVPLSLDKKWNPFAKNIPMITFTSHPLYWHRGSESEKAKYDVEDLSRILQQSLSDQCLKLQNKITIENYVGVGAMLHNRTGLGFFKMRGKISF